MTIQTAPARRARGIDDVLADLAPGKVENEKRVHVESPVNYQKLLSAYELFLHRYEFGGRLPADTMRFIRDRNYSLLGRKINSILSPEQINSFFIATLSYEEHEQYERVTGLFLTKLMQNSYYAGFNDFSLRANVDVDWLGSRMLGKAKDPVRIEFYGNISSAAPFAAYINMVVHGDVGWMGGNAEHCEFTLHGAHLNGVLNSPKECTFKTSNYESAKLFEGLPSNNKLIYIQSDSQEQELRK